MFSIYKILTGESFSLEYYNSLNDEQLKLGQALRLESNELTTAKLNQKPEFICAGTRLSSGKYPVLRIRNDIQFCVDASINPSCVGEKMQISQDGFKPG